MNNQQVSVMRFFDYECDGMTFNTTTASISEQSECKFFPNQGH